MAKGGQRAQKDAKKSLRHAIETAQRHKAKTLELRATSSLCRLWRSQGKEKQAREKLRIVYGWFTEGFDTPDLQAAKKLLDELS